MGTAGLFAATAILAASLSGAIRLSVTVVDRRSGSPVTTLSAGDFHVRDERGRQTVNSASYISEPVDVILLLDTSLIGKTLQPAAQDLIRRLGPGDRMALVSFHSSAGLIQDFTADKEVLLRALEQLQYVDSPHLLDAVYAALDSGFQHAAQRRALLLLTSGVDAPGRVSREEVLSLAIHKQVSVYALTSRTFGRAPLEWLASHAGGAVFQTGQSVWEGLRGHYIVNVADGSGYCTVKVKNGAKHWSISALPLQ